MNKHNLSNASNKRRSNHKPSQSSSASLSKRPVLGRTDSSNLQNNHIHDDSSNIETTRTTTIATIENNNNPSNTNNIIDHHINYDVSCICGKPLIRVTLSESYSDEPSVCCNMCFMIYRNPKDVIYICELRKTTQFHNNGYGFCQSCAAKLSKDEEEAINTSGAQLIKNRLNGTISMLESDGNKHEFLPFMDRMSWFERVGLEYLAKQHMTDEEMKEMKDKLQTIKDTVIERAFGRLRSKIVEIDTMVTRLQEIQMRGNSKLLREYNIKIRIHRRQLLRIQNESSGKYRNQNELLRKLSRMRYCINQQTSEQIASCVCGEELFAMSVQECNYSDSWWCSHCCETYYKHDMLYHCENGKKCIYNELMQYIYDLCEHCWNRLKLKDYATEMEEKQHQMLRDSHHHAENHNVNTIHLMIRKRLWESLQILQQCINTAHNNITHRLVRANGNGQHLEVMDKLAKRICNFETQFVKLKTCLEDEEREKCSSKMQDLVNILKEHLSLCLCGDIMIKLKATNYYCAHCFQTFKGKERVITFCRRRDKCKFYQNGYRLCEHCSNELMKEQIDHTANSSDQDTYIMSTGTVTPYVDEQKHTPQPPQPQPQPSQMSNTNANNSTNILSNHHSEEKEEKKKDIDWTVCCRIEQRLQQSIQILEQSATQDMIATHGHKNDDKTQWNEHWNDWISRCNQFSSCLNKTKEHLHSGQFNTITSEFEIVKKNAVQRTLKQTNESITEISNALHSVHLVREYKKLNANVTEFRRQLLKMKRHGQESDVDIDNQLSRLQVIRDGINCETGERITTCICGEELFRRKASECYGNNYWCNRCFKTYSKDTYLYHCEVHKECEYHQFGYDLCEECAMELRGEDVMGRNGGDNILRIVNRLRASLKILYLDVSNAKREEQHKDDMAKRVDNFEMQYDPLVKWLSVGYLSEMNSKLQEICSLIKPYLPLCLCGSWFKHGSCDNAFICRCCSKSYEKGVETYYCKNTENCLYWKHGYNLCETCALTYRDVKHKKPRLHDRIIHRLWNSINHIWNSIQLQEYEDNNEWDALVLRYDNCEQYIQKCTYTHWLYNILSVHACLDNEECHNMRESLHKLGELFKAHVPVCFCGDVFIYVQSPYELDCKHCFRELKENDKTYFCKSRDDCQHWNNSYYLCEDCVKELRKHKEKRITPNTRIKQRLQRSVQILSECINELIEKHDNDGKKWLKMAYKVDQCKQHSEKLLKDVDDEWCAEFDDRFAALVSSVKIRVPLCLCGAFFVHETSPIDFRCRHCFKLYDSDGVVIHYCQQQRDCQHFNSDYYLCNSCAMSLRLSDADNERMADRAYARLMKSINIINSAVDNINIQACDWKDVSVRVYFYEQQLERLQSHLSTEENGDIEERLQSTLLLMKRHLATCLCGNLFVSGPSPIDYECRSCFHQCRVEDNIYVCKSKQKCQHWRNHYYICDECSILLRTDDNNVSEELRIVNRLRGALRFIEKEFNADIVLNEAAEDRSVELEIFNKYLHRLNSFDTNFLSQMTRHLTRLQFEEIREEYGALKAYMLGISCGYIDERYRDKLECSVLIFGFIHELQTLVCDAEYQIFAAVPEYVFHVCLDYYFQIHPQIFVLSMAKTVFRSLPLKYDNVEMTDLNHGKAANLCFYDMKSFNKCRHSCQSQRKVINITKSQQNGRVIKDKSWNKKECAFTVACNISMPQFIRKIKPSLFEPNHHYDVLFKCGGYNLSNNQNDKQYTNEAVALIVDCHSFNHHYTDHYAFKSRHIGWKAQLKSKQHKSAIHKNYNGYSLNLPCLPQKKRCQILFDSHRKQLLAYCDNKFDIFSLQFNDNLHSENEWKWNRFGRQMKWSRTRPSLMCTDKLLFIVGDTQGHHAKYAEIYSFAAQKWIQTAQCVPYIAHNGCLFSDTINENIYYIGGQERNCGYYDLYKHKWYEMGLGAKGIKTKYIYRQNNSCIWNSLQNECKQILWIANATNCEFYDERDNIQKWQIFPNINDNQTHLKLQNYLNIKYDSTNCDYTLLCRI